ncbi:MAG: SPOR domain-containing protein, partial [Myxococcota bacterium]
GPTTTKRTVENTVYVQDGEAVMIGGIITDRQTQTITKVPFLGDIPILGWAFKSSTSVVQKVNLLIILTPHVIRTSEDLQRATIEQRERFRAQSGKSLQFTDEELDAQQKAQAAGLDLPLDPNPVRRRLEELDRIYPIEKLPGIRERQEAQKRERLDEIGREQAIEGGDFLVQVSLFRSADDAVRVLETLMGRGYDGTVLSRRAGEDLLHFVQLGPYGTDDRAHHIAREVAVATGLDTLVLVEP